MIKNDSALNYLLRSLEQLGGEYNVSKGWASAGYSNNYTSSGDDVMLIVCADQSAPAALPSIPPLLLLFHTPHQPLNETAIGVLIGRLDSGLFPTLLVLLFLYTHADSFHASLSQQAADSWWLVAHSCTIGMYCLLFLLCILCHKCETEATNPVCSVEVVLIAMGLSFLTWFRFVYASRRIHNFWTDTLVASWCADDGQPLLLWWGLLGGLYPKRALQGQVQLHHHLLMKAQSVSKVSASVSNVLLGASRLTIIRTTHYNAN